MLEALGLFITFVVGIAIGHRVAMTESRVLRNKLRMANIVLRHLRVQYSAAPFPGYERLPGTPAEIYILKEGPCEKK